LLGIFLCEAEDGIRDWSVTGVQTCALPIYRFWQLQICLRASVVGLFYLPTCGDSSPVSGTSTASCESLSTDSGKTTSNPCPHLEIGRASCRERGQTPAAAVS